MGLTNGTQPYLLMRREAHVPIIGLRLIVHSHVLLPLHVPLLVLLLTLLTELLPMPFDAFVSSCVFACIIVPLIHDIQPCGYIYWVGGIACPTFLSFMTMFLVHLAYPPMAINVLSVKLGNKSMTCLFTNTLIYFHIIRFFAIFNVISAS